MFCVKCGANVLNGSRFCTTCGARLVAETANEEISGKRRGLWTKRKGIIFIIFSIVLTSGFWVIIYGSDVVSTEDEAVNIIVHLIETIGRQEDAWEKTEQSIDTLFYALSDECLSDPNCVEDSSSAVLTLWAEVEKEKEEIGNLWSEGVLGQDMESYFSKLGDKNLNKILDVFNIYFPEEVEDLEQTDLLLLRR